MRFLNGTIVAACLLLPGAAIQDAQAQVPPHQPGTICFTPQFWCWATPPGPPGSRCGCSTPYGVVVGTLG